ncbi:MAG: AraC family transcriptional regulator [Sphingomonadaceae bacterium]|nr:AraC family transcriptional regulator [Sphingomonadaceae bacterium]
MNVRAQITPAAPAGFTDFGGLVPSGNFKRSGGFDGIFSLITGYGGDADAIMRACEIDPRSFDDSETYVSYPRMVQVLEHCAASFNEPFFGFELGRRQSPDVMGPLAPLMLSSPTVAQALELVERYMAVHAPGARLQLSQSGKEARLTYELLDDASTHSRQINEFSMTAAYNIVRGLAGKDFQPSSIEIASAPPETDRKRLENYFNAPVSYEQPVSTLCFASDFFHRRIDSGNPILLRYAKAQCEAICPEEPQIEQIVASHIRRMMPMGACSLEVIAARLSIHPRSLQNRLTAAGCEFREILKAQRKEMAAAYLTRSRTPIAEIALLLGYADQASFSRAFTGWYQTSPKRFRDAQRKARMETPASDLQSAGQETVHAGAHQA